MARRLAIIVLINTKYKGRDIIDSSHLRHQGRNHLRHQLIDLRMSLELGAWSFGAEQK